MFEEKRNHKLNQPASRRAFLKTACLAPASLAVSKYGQGGAGPQRQFPNIIVVICDDLGYGDPGCYNQESKIPTPNIDRLASQGIRFTREHSPCAVCTPSRYGLLTGRYCWRTWLKREGGIDDYSPPLLSKVRVNVASLLKEHGYATACIGKWHLGLGWITEKGEVIPPDRLASLDAAHPGIDFTKELADCPLDHGFDDAFYMAGAASEAPWTFIRDRRVVNTDLSYKTAAEMGQVRGGLICRDWKQEEIDPTFAGEAVRWIERHTEKNPGQPFFLYFPLSSPHDPPIPPDIVKGKSRLCPRADMVMLADWDLGQITSTLDRLHLSQNTLLIFTSDHGPLPICADQHGIVKGEANHGHRSNAPWRGFKSQVWEGGTRVPFIARWPGRIKPGSVSQELVQHTDVLATCAAIVGANLSPNAGEDSINALPLLLGERLKVPPRQIAVTTSSHGDVTIQQGEWKLILGTKGSGGWIPPSDGSPKPGIGQLYNLTEDPQEEIDQWSNHPEVVTGLSSLLNEYEESGRSVPSI